MATVTEQDLQQHVLAELRPHLAAGVKRFLLAYSGGVDSHVLLHSLLKLKPLHFPNVALIAVHIHHGLSANADHWQQHCQTICDENNIPLITQKVSLDHNQASLEQQARNARYQVFNRQMSSRQDMLLMGHHSDDQLETFFMRVLRGSGLQGLSSIAKTRPLKQGHLLRPLLSLSRQQIEYYAKQNKLLWIEDESNQDLSFERNWWRQKFLPELWQKFPAHKNTTLRTIEQLSKQQQLLSELVSPYLQQTQSYSNQQLKNMPWLAGTINLKYLPQLSNALQSEVLRRWLAQFEIYSLSAIQLQTINVQIINAQQDAQPFIQLAGKIICRYQDALYCLSTEQYAAKKFVLEEGDECVTVTTDNLIFSWPINVAERKGLLCQSIKQADAANLKCKPVNRVSKKIKKWQQENQVPYWLRQQWPLVSTKSHSDSAEIGSLATVQLAGLPGAEGFLLPLWRMNSVTTD